MAIKRTYDTISASFSQIIDERGQSISTEHAETGLLRPNGSLWAGKIGS